MANTNRERYAQFFACLSVLSSPAFLSQINFLFVDPTLHGRGLGSVLLSHVLSEARAVYATIMHATEVVMGVHCFSANAVGMRVYQGRGFVMKSEEVDRDTNESMSYLELSESK
jgi:GNAT superfamily N-acetyltransferase